MTERAVLMRDARNDEALARDGYVVLRGLARDDVDALRDVFRELHPEVSLPETDQGDRPPWESDPAPGARFINDLEMPLETRARLDSMLAPFWQRYLDAALAVPYRSVWATFLMKWPGGDGQMPLHQDPTFVDEGSERSLTIWVALDDTSPELDNGPLYVLPGSHLAAHEYRGPNTASTFLRFQDQLWPLMVPLRFQAGDVMFNDGRLIHGSPPNRTGALRLALATALVPVGSSLYHVVGHGDEEVRLVGVDDDFYRRGTPRSLRAAPPEGGTVVPRAPRPYRLEVLTDLVGSASG